MSRTLVLCEGASPPKRGPWAKAPTIDLCHGGLKSSLALHIENVSDSILRNLEPRMRDLIRIATYIYGADTSVSRGTPKDVYADHWVRTFHLVVPVEDPGHWDKAEVHEALVDAVGFATDDQYSFAFQRGSAAQGQLILTLGEGAVPQADVVTLFSGGIDSLGAVLDAVVREGLKPVLLSHRPVANIDARQKQLVALLRQRFPTWSFPHVSVWAHRRHKRAVENTQRSRAFLYLALAASAAAALRIREVRACDNGVMSINLPRLSQTVGAMASRSTHPVFLNRFQRLLDLTFEAEAPTVSNPFLLKTRLEVVELIRDAGHADLLQETVSCARTEGMTEFRRHCGTCTQCVDRRFATIAAGVEDHDLAERYERDIFESPLDLGDQRTYAEGYLRAATVFSGLTESEFFHKYPELNDSVAAISGPTYEVATRLVDLHRRHAAGVLGVIRRKVEENVGRLVVGELPSSCLVALAVNGQHLRDNKGLYAQRLGALIAKHLPGTFKSHSPANEVEVQEAVGSLLGAAQEGLQREVPQMPFAGVAIKPDFSDLADRANWMFVELKYVKNRSDLRRIQGEMSGRLLPYKEYSASVLFVVYDPKREILDDDKFRAAFEKVSGIWVVVAR